MVHNLVSVRRMTLLAICGLLALSGCGGSAEERARKYFEKARRVYYSVPWQTPKSFGWKQRGLLCKAVELDPGNSLYHLALAEGFKESSPQRHQELLAATKGGGRVAAQAHWYLAQEGARKLPFPPAALSKDQLFLARAADPDNAALDYELAYVYAKAGWLDKAFELIKRGNAKSNYECYWPVRFDAALNTELAIPFEPYSRMRELARRMAYSPSGRTGPAAHPPLSFAEHLVNQGNLEAAMAVCEETKKVGLQIGGGIPKDLISCLNGVRVARIALSVKQELLRGAGRDAEADAVEAEMAKIKSTKDVARALVHGKRGSLLGRAYMWLSSKPLKPFGIYWANIVLLGVPIMVLLVPAVVVVGLLGWFWTRRRRESRSWVEPRLLWMLIVFIIAGASLICLLVAVYFGWNPLLAAMRRASYADEVQAVKEMLAILR